MTRSVDVPFVDLRAQHDEVRERIDRAIAELLDRSAFVGGPAVSDFEAAFAAFVGVDHVVGVGSGTDAVRIALQVVGVQPGDAVVTVAHTFIGTTEGASQIGAVPYFVDVDEDTATMCPAALERFLDDDCAADAGGVLRHRASGRRIAAVVPVHLYGQPADMEPILARSGAAGVPVVEDAAQAQGAAYRFSTGEWKQCGAMGAAAAFSFYPGKNLGAIGEAGAVATLDAESAEHARLLRDHGQSEKYVHVLAHGSNARLDAIQAAVLSIKLERLASWNESRRQAAALYDARLADVVRTPQARPNVRHVYHLYVVQTSTRDRLRAELAERGIGTGLHYPVPLHRQPAFVGSESGAVSLPVTERLASTCLSLPMYPHLTSQDVEVVAAAVTELHAVGLPS